jgi:hypothetical protein
MIRFLLCGDPATRAPLPLKRGRSLHRVALAAAALLLVASSTLAQIGGSYDLTRSTIDGGGATFSTGDGYRLGSTVGQPDAGTLSAGAFVLKGGFWGGINLETASTPTATVTGTVPSTPTTTAPPSPTQTATAVPTVPGTTPTPSITAIVATNTPSSSPTSSRSPLTTPTATVTATPSPTPSPTPTLPACAGDCNQDGSVTVDELIKGVNIALGTTSVDACSSFDANGDGAVTINELIAAVNRALNGCP